jgi:hypothetical protein
MKEGLAAFDQVRSPLNQFLVGSRFMRAFYGAVKGIAAALLTLAFAMQEAPHQWFNLTYQTALVFTWLSVITCVIRGAPVLIEGINNLDKNQ